jgi:hypothetical protein
MMDYMQEFDLIVIGSCFGLDVVANAAERVSVLVSSFFPNYLYTHSADTVEKIKNARLCVCIYRIL